MVVELLIVLVLLIVLIMLFVLFRLSGKVGRVSVDHQVVKGAMATCWKELGIDQDIGTIRSRADDIQKATQNLESLFKVTRGRGEYGEFQLEQILKDLLPSKYVHVRKRVAEIGKIPDAHIVTPQGIICIDSKFPLTNYRRMVESTIETEEADFAGRFRKDVESHIEKIRTDYVRPEEGTTPFAFGFIPSEGVYQYITECEMSLVTEAAEEGVLLVSPATLATNLNLLSVGLKATEISERAEQIQKSLGRLSRSLQEVEESWSTLYTHIRNAYNKAGEVEQKQNTLKLTFQQVTEIEEE